MFNDFISGGFVTLSTLVTTLGWILALGATVTTAPQTIRIFRTRETAGVSVTAAAAGVATMTAWSYFTADIGDIPALASSLAPLLTWVGTLVGVALVRRTPIVVLYGVIAAGISFFVCSAGFAQQLAVAGSIFWTLPQLRVALRDTNLSGVSVLAYGLVAAENVGWVLYAAGTGTWAYAIAPLVQGPAAAVIAYRTARSRQYGKCSTSLQRTFGRHSVSDGSCCLPIPTATTSVH
jgi:uncharacterized protein with PQ loop repeat